MQSQGTALWRWILWHRREFATGAALAFIVAVLIFAGPWLLVLAAAEWKTSRRRKRLLSLALLILLARAVVWLWRDLRDLPHGRWHPCAQCGAPIEEPSRAEFCSPACRRYARVERETRAPLGPHIAARAERRLRLVEAAACDPALAEVPF